MEFVKELPEPVKGGRGRAKSRGAWQDEADEIRERAGEWGLLKVFPANKKSSARSTGINIQHGRMAAFRPAGSFIASTRTTVEGIALWVMYKGEA